ncbi:hypothetical protein B0H19DRAFT_914471, partial [Mycena capillaripes]
QSTNGQCEMTLGLACNIPFKFKGLVYLQVHILKRAPYKCLRGKPFDIVPESVISNKGDGSVTLTLTDPVSGELTMLPTYDRKQGSAKPKTADADSEEPKQPQDF